MTGAFRWNMHLDTEPINWRRVRKLPNGGAVPIGCEENTVQLLDRYRISCRHNEMTKETEVKISYLKCSLDTVREACIEKIRDCARKHSYPPIDAETNLRLIAGRNSYHPVRDWILSKPWDGVDRITLVCNSLVHQEDFSPSLKMMLFRRWVIAAVALVMHSTDYESDEHKKSGFMGTEGVLVLQGKQGLSKTRFFQSLVPPRSEFFRDGAAIDPSNRDSVMRLIKFWIVELGELDATFRKSDVAALRAWLTSKSDTYREPYAKTTSQYTRRTAVCASVNDLEFLPEIGENRRYWVIPVVEIRPLGDLDIQQMWAQAYDAYKAGERFWLEPEERGDLYRSNSQFETQSAIVQTLEECVVFPTTPPTAPPFVFEESSEDDDQIPADSMVVWTSKKIPAPETLSATQVVQRVFGQAAPSRRDVIEASQWLQRKGFPTATNKKYYVRIVKRWDKAKDALVNV